MGLRAAASLHVGVNTGWWSRDYGLPELRGAEHDAGAMAAVAEEAGISDPVVLTGSDATIDALREGVRRSLADLAPDGLFVLTFAGHGIDLGEGGEPDEVGDQSLALEDGILCDDCLADLVAEAPENARTLVVFDSCHADELIELARDEETEIVRSLTSALGDPIDESVASLACRGCSAGPIRASTLILAACEGWESAYDGSVNGAFTEALLSVWDGGRFDGSYPDFVAEIATALPRQTPRVRMYRGRTDNAFMSAKPFTNPRAQ